MKPKVDAIEPAAEKYDGSLRDPARWQADIFKPRGWGPAAPMHF